MYAVGVNRLFVAVLSGRNSLKGLHVRIRDDEVYCNAIQLVHWGGFGRNQGAAFSCRTWEGRASYRNI